MTSNPNSIQVTSDYTKFDTQAYLHDYYSHLEADAIDTMRFLVEGCRSLPPVEKLLDYGCGPGIYQLLPTIPKVNEIHLRDYLDANLNEIRKWVNREPDAFSWSPFTQNVLELETETTPTASAIAEREALTRQKITSIEVGDVTRSPLPESPSSYDIISCLYCLDVVSKNAQEFRKNLEGLLALLKPEGYLFVALLGAKDASGVRYCPVGEENFFILDIDLDTVREILQAVGFASRKIDIEKTIYTEGFPSGSYAEGILAFARS